jgi:hypothetical protein
VPYVDSTGSSSFVCSSSTRYLVHSCVHDRWGLLFDTLDISLTLVCSRSRLPTRFALPLFPSLEFQSSWHVFLSSLLTAPCSTWSPLFRSSTSIFQSPTFVLRFCNFEFPSFCFGSRSLFTLPFLLLFVPLFSRVGLYANTFLCCLTNRILANPVARLRTTSGPFGTLALTNDMTKRSGILTRKPSRRFNEKIPRSKSSKSTYRNHHQSLLPVRYHPGISILRGSVWALAP